MLADQSPGSREPKVGEVSRETLAVEAMGRACAPPPACPIIEGLMGVRLMADDAEHPAIDAAIREIAALRAELRRAHHWDEYHPAYIAGSRAAAYRRAHPDSDRESDRQNGR